MGQFDWFGSIGATPQAVAVLNDQPILFTILIIVLVAVILQIVLLWMRYAMDEEYAYRGIGVISETA
ncbi:hypothetical protein B0T16DRAFT_453901 [Cercophora newfieldiana]|uniref:Uncharacterized protein n=1 Tax=Cercophora newfieldiana TaxID=92897 RepID=A0AA39YF09_9PEZI|nr:hypothetical protein B0T16DRAFT_453901 [Cercophora newfieldiana]